MKLFRLRSGSYVHLFQANSFQDRVVFWTEAVCGFSRTGTRCTIEIEGDPICPICCRFIVVLELAE